jgi:hypothetical protein
VYYNGAAVAVPLPGIAALIAPGGGAAEVIVRWVPHANLAKEKD